MAEKANKKAAPDKPMQPSNTYEKNNCDPGEARTLDPMIKSHLLYQLSYGVKDQSFRSTITAAKVVLRFTSPNLGLLFLGLGIKKVPLAHVEKGT